MLTNANQYAIYTPGFVLGLSGSGNHSGQYILFWCYRTFWLVDLWAYLVYIYIYTLAGLVTTYTLEESSVLECQVVC